LKGLPHIVGEFLGHTEPDEALTALWRQDFVVVAGGTDFYPARVRQAILEIEER
jgi:hypothetical protein